MKSNYEPIKETECVNPCKHCIHWDKREVLEKIYFTPLEFATATGYKRVTIMRWIKDNDIVARKEGGRWKIHKNQLVGLV